MLAVVEHEEQGPGGQHVDDGLLQRPLGATLQVEAGGDRSDGLLVPADGSELDPPHALGPGSGELVEELLHQAGLADASGPDHGDEAGVGDQPSDALALVLAPHQRRRFPRHHDRTLGDRCGHGRRQVGAFGEDVALQLADLGRGRETQLVAQDVAQAGRAQQGLAGPAAAVEGEHELSPEVLPEGMLRDEGVEPTDDIGVQAAGQSGVDGHLVGDDAELVEAGGLVAQEVLGGELGERGTTPLPQCLLGGPDRQPWVAVELAAGAADARLEAGGVEALRRDVEPVAGRAGLDPRRVRPGEEQPAQPRHVGLQRRDGRRRRARPPDRVDETIDGDDPAALGEQDRQDQPGLRSAQRDDRPVVTHLDGTEHPAVHPGIVAGRRPVAGISPTVCGRSASGCRHGSGVRQTPGTQKEQPCRTSR